MLRRRVRELWRKVSAMGTTMLCLDVEELYNELPDECAERRF